MAAAIKQSDISIEMNLKFNEQKAYPQLRAWIARGIWHGMKFFERHFDKYIMQPLIFGGPGWKHIEKYGFWKWLTSPAGFGQLGFSDPNEPFKLMLLLVNSYEVRVTGNPGTDGRGKMKLEMNFFDVDHISRNTIHSAAGKDSAPNMASDTSWFDWILKGKALTEPAKFVKTGKHEGSRSSDIAGSSAGLMTDYGSGLWQVPPKFRLDLEKLITDNEDKIVRVMEEVIVGEMQRYLSL
jgi:hypothetical protein